MLKTITIFLIALLSGTNLWADLNSAYSVNNGCGPGTVVRPGYDFRTGYRNGYDYSDPNGDHVIYCDPAATATRRDFEFQDLIHQAEKTAVKKSVGSNFVKRNEFGFVVITTVLGRSGSCTKVKMVLWQNDQMADRVTGSLCLKNGRIVERLN